MQLKHGVKRRTRDQRFGFSQSVVHRFGNPIVRGVFLVAAGLAWYYTQYALDDTELANAECKAREAERGLWADPRHVAPWDWRKLSKEERDQLR
ncbi:thermonuclease family protein [Stieleria sedimenti]|uniref:thermonuclease family protein n=1 Tax=Stieleria sedimenti TaxID=2976331 RepID=UPI00389A6C00